MPYPFASELPDEIAKGGEPKFHSLVDVEAPEQEVHEFINKNNLFNAVGPRDHMQIAKYIASANVSGDALLSFVELDVTLNETSPVLNLGLLSWPGNLVSGIANVPSNLPAADVIKGLPAATTDEV